MADQDGTASITVFADYVCPFCYLGRTSLERYRETRDGPLAVEWHPFDLRAEERGPDGQIDESVDTGRDEEYFEQARRNVERIRAEYGVEMAQTLFRDVDSRDAQLASVCVQMERPGDWPAFDRGVYEALWRDGRDIDDPGVLADVADDVGIDPDEIENALSDPLVERRLEDQWEAARLKGISGVPTFVYGQHSVRGAVPPEHFEQLIDGP